MKALHTNPSLADQRVTLGRSWSSLFPASLMLPKIRARLRQMPMSKGLAIKGCEVRYQGKGGNQNVQQDPCFRQSRVVVCPSADGLRASHLHFHAGQRTSNGMMKAGDTSLFLTSHMER
jgi:hypothetical protein